VAATPVEIAFAVSGLPSRTVTRSRLNSATSSTKLTAPTVPNLASSWASTRSGAGNRSMTDGGTG
jgi:hypothetical protein